MQIDLVLVHHLLKTLQNGIQADASFDRKISFGFKLLQQCRFVEIMKCIYNFIGKTNKSINMVDGRTQIAIQQSDGAAERVL